MLFKQSNMMVKMQIPLSRSIKYKLLCPISLLDKLLGYNNESSGLSEEVNRQWGLSWSHMCIWVVIEVGVDYDVHSINIYISFGIKHLQ